MPKPELYVIYTQEKKGHPDILSFKETYFSGQECCIDAWAKVIYLDDSDSIINQYIKFCLVHTRQAKIYGYTLTAIKNTIRICKEQNLLRKFLESREMEVEDIMLTLFNQSHVTDTYGLYMMSQGEALGEARGELLLNLLSQT